MCNVILGRALVIQEKTLGPDHPEVAKIVQTLGLFASATSASEGQGASSVSARDSGEEAGSRSQGSGTSRPASAGKMTERRRRTGTSDVRKPLKSSFCDNPLQPRTQIRPSGDEHRGGHGIALKRAPGSGRVVARLVPPRGGSWKGTERRGSIEKLLTSSRDSGEDAGRRPPETGGNGVQPRDLCPSLGQGGGG